MGGPAAGGYPMPGAPMPNPMMPYQAPPIPPVTRGRAYQAAGADFLQPEVVTQSAQQQAYHPQHHYGYTPGVPLSGYPFDVTQKQLKQQRAKAQRNGRLTGFNRINKRDVSPPAAAAATAADSTSR